ncbi:LuxR family transcriptional regulator [Kibdelosporangium phytohabitans]|uniref:LuxR family transcriptional regulator n=1 Tax=Kibdelosporangium phytohabitans TaxID=860235 RepID=A0A0N9IIV6_9PSEU|nr:LuxR family transcriptional regulator [Kibdelosporangium phytohabitans]
MSAHTTEPSGVAVAVHASDPMTALGAASILGSDGRLRVLPESDIALAEMIVIIEEAVGDKALAFLREVRTKSRLDTSPRCVIVTDRLRIDGLTAIQYGTAAVLQRSNTSDDELLRTVVAVSQGAAYLPPWLQGSLLNQFDRIRRDVLEPNGLTMSGMSARERDVLRLLADGHSTEEVAVRVGYSERTVKNVLHSLMSRHGLNNRAHAVAFAWRAGVI